MIIKPKCKGFICTTAHPVGCKKNIQNQIQYLESKNSILGPKRVLIVGASTGFGLASRLVSAVSLSAATLGVYYEKAPVAGSKTASSGWYQTAAFEDYAKSKGLYAKSINGDAFSSEVKNKVIETIKNDLGTIDLLVYSIASPRRIHPINQKTYYSCLKPIGSPYTGKTVDVHTGVISDVTIEPASNEEIEGTVAVMGGEDWEMWIRALLDANLVSKSFSTFAYSYIGPEITHHIYKDGTIGMAKLHLEESSKRIREMLHPLDGRAYISVNKALVTQASSAIPVVPLYISILYKIMKEKGIQEDCLLQMYRLFSEYFGQNPTFDKEGRIRVDNLEMRSDVQNEVLDIWNRVNSENLDTLTDIAGYRKEFYNLFGFEIDGVDYDEPVDIDVGIPGLIE